MYGCLQLYLPPEHVQATGPVLFDGPQHLRLSLLQGLKQTFKVLVGLTLRQLAILL